MTKSCIACSGLTNALRAEVARLTAERDTSDALVARHHKALRFVADLPEALPGSNLAEEAARLLREARSERDALRESAARLEMVRRWFANRPDWLLYSLAPVRAILDGTTPIPQDMGGSK